MSLLLHYIDALIPLVFGVLATFFPQTLTKVDLTQPEHATTAQRFRWAGYLLLTAGAIMLVVRTIEGP